MIKSFNCQIWRSAADLQRTADRFGEVLQICRGLQIFGHEKPEKSADLAMKNVLKEKYIPNDCKQSACAINRQSCPPNTLFIELLFETFRY